MVKCEDCDREFSSNDGLNMHNQSKHPERVKKPTFKVSSKNKKKVKNWIISIVIIVSVIWGITFLVSNVKTLPPMTMQGHAEVNPPSHILKEPMSLIVHKHMLEHSDGDKRPGAIINYNCKDYKCEDDLIEKLEGFAIKYPNHVYVAPFPKMDAKIVLTKEGRQKVLEEYEEEVIDLFVR